MLSLLAWSIMNQLFSAIVFLILFHQLKLVKVNKRIYEILYLLIVMFDIHWVVKSDINDAKLVATLYDLYLLTE